MYCIDIGLNMERSKGDFGLIFWNFSIFNAAVCCDQFLGKKKPHFNAEEKRVFRAKVEDALAVK